MRSVLARAGTSNIFRWWRGGADGKVYFLTAEGAPAGEVAAGPRPVISIAISPDGALVAAAGIGGTVAVIDRKARTLTRTLVGPGLPVWSF